MTALPNTPGTPVALPLGGPQVFILDTGVLYDDVVYRLRHPESRGVLLGGARTGTIRLFAAEHVYEELYDSLEGFERRRIDRNDFVRCLERHYLPHIHFVTMPPDPVPARALMVPDVDDRPTAALALMIAPCFVLAKDRHLVDAGFGRPDDWLSLAWRADELVGFDGVLMVATLGASRAVGLARDSARWFLDDISPRDVAFGAALGSALLVAAPRAIGASKPPRDARVGSRASSPAALQ